MLTSQTLPRSSIRLDAHDLLIQLLSQLDTTFADVGIKIEQLADGHAISLRGKMVDRGLTSSDVYGRAIRVAVVDAQTNAASHGLAPGGTDRTWLESCRRDAAYAALAEHKFASAHLGQGAWEFPTSTSMEVTVYLAQVGGSDSAETRFRVNFADAMSAAVVSVETDDDGETCADGAHERERARC